MSLPPPKPIDPHKVAILWRGKTLSLMEASLQAMQEQQQGNLQAAVDLYTLILEKIPASAEACNNRGALLQMMKRYEEALANYDQAIALKPDYVNCHFNRAITLKQLNRLEEALAGYDRALALNPNHAEAHNNRGAVLQQMRRYAEAIASYEKAMALNPGHAAAHNNRGTALMSTGNMEEAGKMFRQALALKPDFADPYHSLAKMRQFKDPSDPDVQSIRALLQKPGLPAESKEHLLFTLGKIYDDCGLYDEAFEYFRQANQIRNSFVAYDPAEVTRIASGIMDVFNGKFFDRRHSFASNSRLPLLVVGMPRSGTTLLASILSNHPAIATAGELPTIGEFALNLGKSNREGVQYPYAANYLTPAIASPMIEGYEKRLRRDLRPGLAHVIDKNPLNFVHLGFVTMLFPQAKIIHCTRDPLDTCLSNYFTRFPLNLHYSFDLKNIGHFYNEYMRFMDHWRNIPAIRILDIRYEDLILNTETAARKMLDFLGLEWDDRCLSPHTNPAPIETASEWQVRQPIYRHALERWRHYEKHLGPLKEMLQGG